ncbi:MAG: ribosome biogenesis GTPase YlqF [Clostridia bacterium]|nr:ribosome biogenesis GTPase YlqF [Clostridia bacterium]
MEENKTNINWYPGHMAKTRRQISEDLKLIDVVIELLDARIPVSSQNPDIAGMTNGKKRIVLLNKADLADKLETKKWIEFFEKKGIPCLDVDSNSGRGVDKVNRVIESLMKDEIEKKRARGIINKTIRVMILGIPNVGKSSFINRVSKKTSMVVGNKPGVTRQKQWIRLGSNIELLDTPGVLWPKFEEEIGLNLAYTGSIKDDIFDRVEIAYSFTKYMINNYFDRLIDRYGLDESSVKSVLSDERFMENERIYEVMKMIGKRRGAIVSGGEVDDEKVSRIILDDFRSGKFGEITLEKVVI